MSRFNKNCIFGNNLTNTEKESFLKAFYLIETKLL